MMVAAAQYGRGETGTGRIAALRLRPDAPAVRLRALLRSRLRSGRRN